MIRKAIIIFLLAITARALYLTVLPPGKDDLTHADSSMYLSLADDMITSGGFNRRVAAAEGLYNPETERAPLYPAFLALIKLTTVNFYPFSVVVWQALIDSMTCVIIAAIAAEFLPGLFMLAGIFAAFNLTMIVLSGQVLTDTLFLFFFSISTLAAIQYLKNTQLNRLALASILLGLSVLTRPVSLYFLPLFSGFCLIVAWAKSRSLPRVATHFACSLLIFICLLGPLMYRNYKLFGHASMVSQSGSHLLYWVVPLTLHLSQGISYAEAGNSMQEKLDAYMRTNKIKILPGNPFENSQLLATVASNALLEVGLIDLSKAWLFGSMINLLSPSPIMIPYVQSLKRHSFYYTDGDSPYKKLINFLKNEDNLLFSAILISSIIVTFLYFILQLIGIIFMLKKLSGNNWIIIAYILSIFIYFLIITGPIIGIKYRIPVEPVLILFLSYAAYMIINKFSANKLYDGS